MPPGVFAQGGAMPLRRPPHADRLLGSDGRRPQPEAVEPLDPLAVVDVGLGAVGGALHLAGVDQPHPDPCAFAHIGERDPVHPGRCQGHRRPLALPQPGSHGVQVGRAGPEAADVGGTTAGARGTEGDATALGGTQTQNSVAPLSMPAAGGLRVCSKAAVAGSGRDEAGLRRGIPSSSMSAEHTRAAGGGGAGAGRLPTGIDTNLGHQGGSSPTTRPQTPRSRLPNGHEAPQRGRIARPAAGSQESTAPPWPPLFPAVGAPRRG